MRFVLISVLRMTELEKGVKDSIITELDGTEQVVTSVLCLFFSSPSLACSLPPKMVITFTPEEFQVALSDGSTIHFQNRMGAEKYSVINVEGDARITSIEIK